MANVIGLAAASAVFAWALSRLQNNSTFRYVVTTSDCDRAIEIIRRHLSKCPILGLDCEWEPEYGTRRNKVQVISLATLEGYCVVLQISRFSIPQSLRSLLRDTGIFKVGVGIRNDELHLAYNGLQLNSWVDIRHLEKSRRPDKSLKGMAQRVLGVNLDKRMQLGGNWDGHLTEDQIQYAAKDAEAGIRICIALFRGRHVNKDDALVELRQFVHRSYPLPKCYGAAY